MTTIYLSAGVDDAQTRGELRTALLSYGFDYLTTDQANRMLDEAVREVTEEELWKFRESDSSGIAPLVIPDLGQIDSIKAGTRVLKPVRRSQLESEHADITLTGEPRYYYIDGEDTVRTYPVSSTVELDVRYYSAAGWTISGGYRAASDDDTPRLPPRYVELVLLVARMRAKEENDDFADVQSLYNLYQTRLEQAKQALLKKDWDEPEFIRVTEDWGVTGRWEV